jgi:hypothetical protein
MDWNSSGDRRFLDTAPSPLPRPAVPRRFDDVPGGSSLSVFTAVGTGGTTVSAMSDAPCLHMQPSCELGQQGVEIYVVVRRS